MVFSSDVPGIKAQVLINGVPCQEYENEDEELQPKETVRYIEAIPGQNFSLKVKFKKTYPHQQYSVSCHFYVDGICADSILISSEKLTKHSMRCYGVCQHSRDGLHMLPFRFAELKTTEDCSSDKNLLEKAKSIGLITIKILRSVHNGTCYPAPTGVQNHAPLASLPEKALKGRALSAQTTFDAPKRYPVCKFVKTQHVDSLMTPLYTFKFKYLTQDDLVAERIITTDATNEESNGTVPNAQEETQTASQLAVLLKQERSRVRELEERLEARVNGSQDGQPSSRIKRERSATGSSLTNDDISFVSARHAKRSRPDANTEIVDLLDD